MVLEVTHTDTILELTLNRPEALNAFTVEMHRELAAALKDARKPQVRAGILTAAGRAFSAARISPRRSHPR